MEIGGNALVGFMGRMASSCVRLPCVCLFSSTALPSQEKKQSFATHSCCCGWGGCCLCTVLLYIFSVGGRNFGLLSVSGSHCHFSVVKRTTSATILNVTAFCETVCNSCCVVHQNVFQLPWKS